MSKKKLISKNNEHVKQMRILKSRLVEISLKVDNYIYKKKQLTKAQARCFLDELCSYKTQCDHRDRIEIAGYLQVIEKLTKYMKIIIKNKDDGILVTNVHLNDNHMSSNNNNNVINGTENITAAKEISPLEETMVRGDDNEKQNNCDPINSKATCNYNALNLDDKTIKSKDNILPSKYNANNNISPKDSEQVNSTIAQTDCQLQETNFEKHKKCDTNHKMAVTVDERSINVDTVSEDNSFQNSYCLYVSVNKGVITNDNLTNVPFKTVNFYSEPITIPLEAPYIINKSDNKQVFCKNVNKQMTMNNSSKKTMKKKVNFSDVDNLKKQSVSLNNREPTMDNHKNMFLKKEKKSNDERKNINSKKEKRSGQKTAALNKNQINRNSNNDKFFKSLTWIENIKYVREVSEIEYFEHLEITGNFWNDQTIPPITDKEFNE